MLEILFSLQPIYSLSIVAAFMSLLIALIYRFFGNYKEMRRIKLEMNDLKEPLAKARKEKNEKKLLELMKRQNELAMEQFKLMMRPMLITMIMVIFIFNVLKRVYSPMNLSFVLPFPLPFAGKEVGWLGFYIIMSLPLTIIFRKILRLD